MYPRNAASPPSVLIGEVVQISDGAVQTTGVSVRVKTGSGAWGAGAGTLACDTTSGVWEYTPTQAETNGDTIKIAIYKSACLGASATLVTTAEATAGTVKLGAAQTADITGSLSGSVGSVTGNVGGSVASVTGGINTGAGTITTLDALDTAQDTQHSTTQSAISGLNDPTAAAIADAVWDEATSGHATAGTTGKALTDVLADTNELQTNQGNWLTATGFSTHSAADVWSVATRVLTAATNITSDGSAITMSSAGVVGTVNLVNTTTTNTDMRGTDNALLAASAPANFSDLAITVTTGRVDVGSIEGLDATDQIRDAVVDDATRIDASALNTAAAAVGSDGSGLTEAGGTGDHLTGVPWNAAWDSEVQSEVNDGLVAFWTSPATLVDLFWDEATSGHTTAGTTGKALTDAGSAGDPWTTALPGAYSAGTAGYLVGTYLDAAVSGANTVTPLDAAGFRSAVGLAAANLDTQLGNIPTVAEFEARTLLAANYFDPAADTVANVTTVGTVNALAANSVNASALASDAAAEIGNGFLATTLTKGTAGTIERAFWQILKAQAVTDGEVAGTPTTTTFDTTLTAATGVYNHQLILFTSGALAGESRPITTYTQASGVITLQEALTAAPSASDEFIILPVHVHPISEIQAGLATSSEISALNDLSAADVNTQVDVALADIHLDHLFATAYDPASKPGAADALLNELIGDDAGVSQFTANALELAPTGSGLDAAGVRAAVGLATANLDAQLSTITADTNELQTDWANGGRLDSLLDTAASAGAGSGARTVAVTVDDGTNPLQNAIVRMSEGANTYTLTTNASGQGTFNLDDATYTVAIYKAGYTFAGTTTVVSADATPTYSMTAVSISAPANPAMTTAYLNVYDISGALLANETFTYQQTTAPTGTGTSFEPDSGTATSDGNGLLQIAMYKGSYYDITRPSGPTATVEIPSDAGSTYELPNMI